MTDPWGIRFLRSGFARSPEADRAFALGWPYMRCLNESLSFAEGHGSAQWSWDTDEATARVRYSLQALEIATGDGPLSPAEAKAYARHLIPFGPGAGADSLDLFLLEAVTGSDVLAEAMVSSLEEISGNEWRRASPQAERPFYEMGFGLLRASTPLVVDLRQRLSALLERHKFDSGPLTCAVDMVLHGAAAVRRCAAVRGGSDADIDPRKALLAHDDPTLVAAIANASLPSHWIRHCAARLAFLSDDPAVWHRLMARWYEDGDEQAQRWFLATMGEVAHPCVGEAIRAGANISKIQSTAISWITSHSLPPAPVPPKPVAPSEPTITRCEADEFGFTLLPAEAAEKLSGESDHDVLTQTLDPDTARVEMVEIHASRAAVFCLYYGVAVVRLDDGCLVVLGGDEEDDETIEETIVQASARRWLPMGELELASGRLVGTVASLTAGEARQDGKWFELGLPVGRYQVLQTALADDEEDGQLTLIWLRRTEAGLTHSICS